MQLGYGTGHWLLDKRLLGGRGSSCVTWSAYLRTELTRIEIFFAMNQPAHGTSELFLFWSKTIGFMNVFYLDEYLTQMAILPSSLQGPSLAVSQFFWLFLAIPSLYQFSFRGHMNVS